MSSTKVYAILTNKTYLGIRVINTGDEENREEVPAVWEPIIDRETFEKVQTLLQKNREKFHSRGNQRYLYSFSGLLRCGKCGEKLQGQSAYSSTNKRHYYYSHKGTCRKGGCTRINAETVHSLVFDWLRNLADKKDEFKRLQDEGYRRIEKELSQLKEERQQLETAKAGIADRIEGRIQELVKTKSETVRKTIEKSIEKLETDRQETDEKAAYVNHAIFNIENLVKNDADLFSGYRKRIRDVLELVEKPTGKDGKNGANSAESMKNQVKTVITSLVLGEKDIKIALSGVNHSGLHSSVFAPSLRPKQRISNN